MSDGLRVSFAETPLLVMMGLRVNLVGVIIWTFLWWKPCYLFFSFLVDLSVTVSVQYARSLTPVYVLWYGSWPEILDPQYIIAFLFYFSWKEIIFLSFYVKGKKVISSFSWMVLFVFNK